MTFTEAAVEILRLAGRPLHYKKITELAIGRNLLSHIGKAPELTMSSRLATMVKKDRGDEPIVKVKPGVFALRDFTPAMLALADEGDDIDVSQLPPEAKVRLTRADVRTELASASAALQAASRALEAVAPMAATIDRDANFIEQAVRAGAFDAVQRTLALRRLVDAGRLADTTIHDFRTARAAWIRRTAGL